ncbi:SusC/RagA family TonB-linked outer membrane protein [Pedobacter sp. BS3]|uniref:SusC/RagA family TonB-linked outer membrane protein n=1 Tax=Pedobacter sp. BS3 TaxID=2567937 RepID=UPI0011EE579F|nr:SusC/RagA family TonB-linked outer membrane protein [Pedobacter sp. BS3]TZF82785.1 SusC/RagA family TonB-linked outer membrane protein [Pedobacter sp. BS3]
MHNYYLKGKIVRLFYIFLFLSAFSDIGFAQTAITVKGIIKDDYGNPLPGVSVRVKGSAVNSQTDDTGTFTIQASANDKLIISHAGFGISEVQVQSGKSITVQLTPNYLQQPEVITLLDKKQPASELLQATATVTTPQLTTTPAPSFLQALPGRLSGLYTRQRSGVQDSDDPVSVMDFRIRGQNPLILVDGVPRDFSSIEPESIESITVLKDALSTVMYGQRSSDNMILVTTRRPVVSPFKLSATVQHGVQSMLNMPKPLSAADYAILYNEARENDGMPAAYTAADIAAYRDGSDPYGHPNNNWQKEFLNKTTNLDRYNLNIQSGNQMARFYVALDYENEGGFFKTAGINTYNTNSSVDRYIVRSNVSVDINKSLNVGLNIFGRIQNTNQPGGGASGIYTAIATTPANAYPIFNPDGSLGGNPTYSKNIYGLVNSSGYTLGTTRDLATDMEITQKLNFLPGLYIKGNISYNNTVDQTVNRSKSTAVFYNNPAGSANYQIIGSNSTQGTSFALNTRRTYTYGKLSLGYNKHFGDNNLNAVVLADRQSTTIDIALPAIYTNYAANVTYNYKEKYFAEGAASYGGFNRYRPGHRFGMFYAGGLGWNLAKEDFLAQAKWLNTLKPRITYGRTGNANVGYYIYDQYYDATGTVYYFGSNGSGTAAKGYEELALANPNATWEKADKLNIGLDLAILNNRLKVTSEYFNDTYFDLMQTRGTSSSLIGQAYPTENIGKNRYSGVENSITWNSYAGNFNYFVSGNASVLKTKVLYQDEVYRQYAYQRHTGLPVGQAFGYIADGFFQSQQEINNSPVIEGKASRPGDLKYRDLNDDGVINQFDETAIGTQKPMIYYGLTAGFTVKGFDLSISLQGVANYDVLMSAQSIAASQEYEFQDNTGNVFRQHLYRWTPTNTENALYPRLSIGGNPNNQHNSTFWIRHSDYLRLQNVDIGYTLPLSVTRRLKLNGIRVFVNGFNLYSFDSLDDDKDPENYNSVYPLRRTFNAGINIKL